MSHPYTTQSWLYFLNFVPLYLHAMHAVHGMQCILSLGWLYPSYYFWNTLATWKKAWNEFANLRNICHSFRMYCCCYKYCNKQSTYIDPSIAQLVEQRTVVVNDSDILRSLVQLRLEGVSFIFIFTFWSRRTISFSILLAFFNYKLRLAKNKVEFFYLTKIKT